MRRGLATQGLIMLTRKQHELLIFIDRHLKTSGYSPSFDEMKEALNLRSKSGIHRLISALEERGFLSRRHHQARALEVLRLPGDNGLAMAVVGGQDGASRGLPERAAVSVVRDLPKRADGAPGFAPTVIHGDFSARLAGGARRTRGGRRAAAALRADCRWPSDRGNARYDEHLRGPCRPAGPGRTLRAGGCRRLDDRCRHSGRRHGHHPPGRDSGERADRGGVGR